MITINEIIIPDFTKNDYTSTTTPFEWLYKYKDQPFVLNQLLIRIKDQAGSVGVRNFTTLYKAYLQTVNQKNGIVQDNATNFDGQKLELKCGEWVADEFGVSTLDKFGFEVHACNHPILPVQRLINIDTGIEKLKIDFRKGKVWRSLIADKKTLASNNAILSLADYGVAVNSENSKHLVKYLTDVEHLNYDTIPEVNAVGRLGWIEDYGFSPYVEDLVFDGDKQYKQAFESVKARGSYTAWVEKVKEIRKYSLYGRLMLASSFASVLVSICDSLPFFVHLWGGTESGKTVALMLATSVWAHPEIGRYIHTFNSTAVAQELYASFVNSMPLIIDELQIIKDKKSFDDIIYQLAEGVGRSRGQKSGGLQKVSTWKNCILTTGEHPISSSASGAGAINRIIEADCKNVKIFENPKDLVSFLFKNHGHAGKEFVSFLEDKTNREYAVSLQNEIYKRFEGKDTTDKQAASASLILTADTLIEEWIFKDGIRLTIDDMLPLLSTKNEVDQNKRALEFIYDYVGINANKFTTNNFGEYDGEIYGKIDDNYIYIINTQFSKLMKDNGYNAKAFLSWASGKGILRQQNGKNTVTTRIQKMLCRCIAVKILKEDVNESNLFEDEDDDLPY